MPELSQKLGAPMLKLLLPLNRRSKRRALACLLRDAEALQ